MIGRSNSTRTPRHSLRGHGDVVVVVVVVENSPGYNRQCHLMPFRPPLQWHCDLHRRLDLLHTKSFHISLLFPCYLCSRIMFKSPCQVLTSNQEAPSPVTSRVSRESLTRSRCSNPLAPTRSFVRQPESCPVRQRTLLR